MITKKEFKKYIVFPYKRTFHQAVINDWNSCSEYRNLTNNVKLNELKFQFFKKFKTYICDDTKNKICNDCLDKDKLKYFILVEIGKIKNNSIGVVYFIHEYMKNEIKLNYNYVISYQMLNQMSKF